MSGESRVPLPVIIDTDPGLGEPGSDIDDGLAIALALRSPELEILGLTTVNGNVDVATGTDVARRLTDRLGVPDLPVLQGADAPLTRDMRPVRQLFDPWLRATQPLGAPGEPPPTLSARIGPTTDQPASEFLVRQIAARPGQVTIIAIGPMTNLALAIRRDPRFATNVRELVLMAGSATTYAQNVTVVGDFNTYVDPEALDTVIRSGARIRMVGIDQTSKVMLTRSDARSLRATGEAFAQWVADCTDGWIGFLGRAFPARPEHADACFLHDPLVVGAVIEERLCTWAEAEVTVETTSELARGLVVADRGLALKPAGSANAQVAIETDVSAFRELLLSRIR